MEAVRKLHGGELSNHLDPAAPWGGTSVYVYSAEHWVNPWS